MKTIYDPPILYEIPGSYRELDKEALSYYQQICQLLLEWECLDLKTAMQAADLAWWLGQRDKLIREVEKYGLFHVYENSDGSVKHTQVSGPAQMLQAAENNIVRLKKGLNLTGFTPRTISYRH